MSDYEGTHIRFVEGFPKPKTLTWFVVNRYEDSCIGNIGWFARWRKYSFFPEPNTVYEEVCLREIAAFCEMRTAEHHDHPAPTPSASREAGGHQSSGEKEMG